MNTPNEEPSFTLPNEIAIHSKVNENKKRRKRKTFKLEDCKYIEDNQQRASEFFHIKKLVLFKLKRLQRTTGIQTHMAVTKIRRINSKNYQTVFFKNGEEDTDIASLEDIIGEPLYGRNGKRLNLDISDFYNKLAQYNESRSDDDKTLEDRIRRDKNSDYESSESEYKSESDAEDAEDEEDDDKDSNVHDIPGDEQIEDNQPLHHTISNVPKEKSMISSRIKIRIIN